MKRPARKLLNLSALTLILFLVCHAVPASTGEIYKWVDEEGTVHMTDSISNIPPKYRGQIEKKTLQTATEADWTPESPQSTVEENSEQATPNLARFEVPYQAFEGTARRIIIPVTFNESVTANLLMDTGSPGLLISPKLADSLGLLDEEDGNLLITARGIGGSAPAMLALVDTIRVGDARTDFLPATIAEVPSDEFEGLIGMDFLANYGISIDTTNNVVLFYELPPQSDRPGGHDEAWWRSNFQRFLNLKDRWAYYLEAVRSANLTSSETEKLLGIVKNQHDEADQIYRKLEIYARDNAVPITWRH